VRVSKPALVQQAEVRIVGAIRTRRENAGAHGLDDPRNTGYREC
jgi:hypothetical protein